MILSLAAGRARSEDNRVGLVVQYGDGSVFMGCYPWTADLTGESLLRRAGLNVEADYSSMGALICRIGPDGCSASDCLCQAQTPPLRYWAYWRLDRAHGDWVYSQQGSSNRALQPGDVDGWAWGVGTVALGAKPPKVTFEQVCPAPTATPPPSLAYTVTPAPIATHTPLPATATSVPPPVAHFLPSSTPPPTATTAPSPTTAPTSTPAPAVAAGEAPSATPPPTDTPPAALSAALPTATADALAAAAPDIILPSPTSPPQPGAAPPAAAVGMPPTATRVSNAGATSPSATPTTGPGGSDTRSAGPNIGPAPRAPAVATLGTGGVEPRAPGPVSRPASPNTGVVAPRPPDAPATPPAGATVNLSRLTPVAGSVSRAVEGFNSQAPMGYIAFVGLVAGLGAVLWLRRRGDL